MRAVGLTSGRGWAPVADPEVATEALGMDGISQRTLDLGDHQCHKRHSIRSWKDAKTTMP